MLFSDHFLYFPTVLLSPKYLKMGLAGSILRNAVKCRSHVMQNIPAELPVHHSGIRRKANFPPFETLVYGENDGTDVIGEIQKCHF